MPKYVVHIEGDCIGAVGDNNTVEVYVNGRRVQPERRPPSEAKRRLWDWLQRAERVIQELPMEDPRWVRLVITVQDRWEQYNQME